MYLYSQWECLLMSPLSRLPSLSPPRELSKEMELQGELEQLRSELSPLEAQRETLARRAQRRTNAVIWGGMAFMSLQFGFFARLTWWEYSWDIMEPVTYFVTYGTSMAMFAYFVITKQVSYTLLLHRSWMHVHVYIIMYLCFVYLYLKL